MAEESQTFSCFKLDSFLFNVNWSNELFGNLARHLHKNYHDVLKFHGNLKRSWTNSGIRMPRTCSVVLTWVELWR